MRYVDFIFIFQFIGGYMFENQRFPRIAHLDDLLPWIQDLPEIKLMTQSNQSIVACYLVGKQDTFNHTYARECRGITFDGLSKKVICRPLHKFFNINEREETQLSALSSEIDVVRMMDKMDGSMLSPALIDGQIDFKTKKSFESDVAKSAKTWLFAPQQKGYIEFCLKLLSEGLTPIFEYVSPQNRIVLNYEKENLTLLHVRDQITGDYLNLSELRPWLNRYEIPVIEEFPKKAFTEIMDDLKVRQGIEGYVIQFKNGEMVKAKTEWYLKLHKCVTFLRKRDVALLVLEEKIDDVKSAILETQGTLDAVLEIEADVVQRLNDLQFAVEEIYEKIKEVQDRKSIALQYKDHPYFSLIMSRYSGKEVDYQGYFIRNLINEYYDLSVINTGKEMIDLEG